MISSFRPYRFRKTYQIIWLSLEKNQTETYETVSINLKTNFAGISTNQSASICHV